jgi:hypothetical protein
MNLSLASINTKFVYAGVFIFVCYLLIEYFTPGFGQTFDVTNGVLLPFFGLGGSSSSGSESGASDTNTSGTGLGNISCGGCTQSEFSNAASDAGYDVTNSAGSSQATNEYGETATWNSSSGGGSGGGSVSSTPFLKVWNGAEFVFENDFLFGKPKTAFDSYAQGLAAYTRGIGGDTYVLRSIPQLKDGKLQFQIREIEPEESFIDSFAIHAIDIASHEALVVDGNLKDVYVFDIKKSAPVSGQKIRHYHKKQNVFTDISFDTSDIFATHDGGVMLEKGDELLMTVPRTNLMSETSTFIMVDSHFRDWTLGEQVPFSALDRFTISSWALGRSVVTTAFGVSLALGATLMTTGISYDLLKKAVATPYAHADTPHCTYNCGGWSGGGKSLKVSVVVGGVRVHLQTLFPRFVQASKEVVQIPATLLNNLDSEFVTVCIEATKRHKVSFASLVLGNTCSPALTNLTDVQVTNVKTGVDVSALLTQQNGTFVHTKPGDVYTVSVGTIPSVLEGAVRHYVLKAHGFYTKMSDTTKREIGDTWYTKLDSEDRQLLRRLKQFNV